LCTHNQQNTHTNEFTRNGHEEVGFDFGVAIDVVFDDHQQHNTHNGGDESHRVGLGEVPKKISVCLQQQIPKTKSFSSLNTEQLYLSINMAMN
jgi:hypothetical protein